MGTDENKVVVRRFRTALVVAALLAPLLPLALQSPSAGATATASHSSTRVLALGADIKPASGQSRQDAILAFEALTGHRLAYTRDFLWWNSAFPTSYESWLGARGTMPLISVEAMTAAHVGIPWKKIATAKPGSTTYGQMKGWADRIKAFGYPVYFTLSHEPEETVNNMLGPPADFIAAWGAMHAVFAAEGVTNAKFMWIMTANSFLVKTSDRRYGWHWYPGDPNVDAIAVDAYTEFTCRYTTGLWHPLSYKVSGFLKFGQQHPTKPMWLAEFGVVEDPAVPGRKAQWITDAQALFKQPAYQQFVGVAYFNQTRPGTPCDWHIQTSASATAAYVALATDPFYAGVAS